MNTAEEFLKKDFNNESGSISSFVYTDIAVKEMIEFAKLHVKAALKQASKNAKAGHTYPYTHNEPYVDKNSILKVYSLNKII